MFIIFLSRQSNMLKLIKTWTFNFPTRMRNARCTFAKAGGKANGSFSPVRIAKNTKTASTSRPKNGNAGKPRIHSFSTADHFCRPVWR